MPALSPKVASRPMASIASGTAAIAGAIASFPEFRLLRNWILDFMSVKERPVYTSANLAMFMVNLSHALIRPMLDQWPAFSINDLKAWFRGRKYAVEMLKLLPESPDAIFIDQVVAHMAELGRVNHALNPS